MAMKAESSVTRLGDFLIKFLVINLITKVAQLYRDFWAVLKNVTLM